MQFRWLDWRKLKRHAEEEQQVKKADSHDDPASCAGAARGGSPVTTEAAVPNETDHGDGDHGQEDQDATQGQCHVETWRFVPGQLYSCILGHEVGKQVGDTTAVVLTKNHGEWTVYLAEVERLHFYKSE